MKSSKVTLVLFGLLILLVPVSFLLVNFLPLWMGKPASLPAQPRQRVQVEPDEKLAFARQHVGLPVEGRPWIPHLVIVDLDQDGLQDIVVCDGIADTINWIRQEPLGVFEETILAEEIKGPAHAEPQDFDHDGDLDLLIASMGIISPSNDSIGSVIILENDGRQQFIRRTLIEGIARVTDVRGADFDGDGDTDLAVGQFGYAQGEIRWMENLGEWEFQSHHLLGLSGTVHTPVGDIDGDRDMDFVALVSQEWEEVHLFANDGNGNFQDRLLWGSTNEDYGSSGLDLADLDGDGDLDIIYTNGDGFDYAKPGPRPWHGIQWIENLGGQWKFHRVSDFPGAYSPVCADLNGDGFKDLLAVASVNKWEDPETVSLMAWLNDGSNHFTAVPLATIPTHLIVADVGDLDGDGIPEIVTGGLHFYPPFGHLSRVSIWRRTSP